MKKQVFWPAALVTLGLIIIASNMGMLPSAFWNFWPVLLIVVGLGGLLTSDRDEWMVASSKKSSSKPAASAKRANKKAAKKSSKKRS